MFKPIYLNKEFLTIIGKFFSKIEKNKLGALYPHLTSCSKTCRHHKTHTITGLETYTQYLVSLQVFNPEGPGPLTTVLVMTDEGVWLGIFLGQKARI
ncbi:hypothetical protein J437_LFUL006044 [Ladona fulva]|uniref:Uncharacterized protein n=1 Tax=Ladona fulva TaxID=123851 RepID=A0A8K0K1G4_LADFU|nr:hypothetical protein J437_LFUL006044 [Ladona fulva]